MGPELEPLFRGGRGEMGLPESGSTGTLRSPSPPAERRGAGGRREGSRSSCSPREAPTFREAVSNRPEGARRSRGTTRSERWETRVVVGSGRGCSADGGLEPGTTGERRVRTKAGGEGLGLSLRCRGRRDSLSPRFPSPQVEAQSL